MTLEVTLETTLPDDPGKVFQFAAPWLFPAKPPHHDELEKFSSSQSSGPRRRSFIRDEGSFCARKQQQRQPGMAIAAPRIASNAFWCQVAPLEVLYAWCAVAKRWGP